MDAIVCVTLCAVAIKKAKPNLEILKVELSAEERTQLPGLNNKYDQRAELANTGIIELADRDLSELS